MTGVSLDCLHATCLELVSAGRSLGVLLRGPSGSGKSMLALRLMDEAGSGLSPEGMSAISAGLVSDDQVCLRLADGALFASAPATIAGLLEVRGLGIVEVPHMVVQTRLVMVIDHAPLATLEHLPADGRTCLFGSELS